jgi:hypothetical protein
MPQLGIVNNFKKLASDACQSTNQTNLIKLASINNGFGTFSGFIVLILVVGLEMRAERLPRNLSESQLIRKPQ